MKSSAIIRIILFSLAIIILGSVLLGVLSINRIATKLDESGALENLNIAEFVDAFIDEEYDEIIVVPGEGKTVAFEPAEINSLEIDWVAGSIVIAHADTDTITISEDAVSREKYEMQVSRSGKTVEIEYCEDGINNFGITSLKTVEKDLVITVPMDWKMNTLEVDAASADLSISDMSIQIADFDMASGEIQMQNCNVDKIDLDTASGDVEFSGKLNVLECDSASANCVIEVYNAPQRINMSSASGNLELFLPEDCGFTCSMETLSGHFSSDFPTSNSDGLHIYGNGSCRIDMDAMSGNIIINKSETVAP